MEWQLQKTMRKTGPLLLPVVFIIIFFMMPAAQALEPVWNYSASGVEIGGLAVSPKGDLIVAGAEKVLFFSKNGTILAKEPFGNGVVMTRDGKYTASVYFSSVYLFRNPVPAGSATVTRLAEYEFSERVQSIDVSRDGSIIAGRTLAQRLVVFNTGTGVARGNTRIDSVIKISSSGGRIVGISQGTVHAYSSSGTLTRTSNVETGSDPHTMLLSSTGYTAFINDGQKVRSLNTNDGDEYWNRQVNGFITALAMNPDGSLIVAGTETGNIAALDENGNLSWNYASNPENRQNAGITCTALSDKAALIAAGTADGKIVFLNSRGELAGSWNGREYIRHIAVSADGSLIVAATEDRMYVFSPSSFPILPVPTPTRSVTPTNNATNQSPTVQSPQQTVSIPSPQTTIPASPTEVPTTYSVIRTATQSPPALVTLLLSLALVMVIAGRKR